MPILRDIAARLGLQLDKKSFVTAERSIGGLVGQLGALSTIVIGSGAIFALGKIITLGSDANETLNVLEASFGENTKAVKTWADNFGTAAGRSEFELREMASTLGAVLNPLMERNQEVAADMSTQLTELAVDLGSFFNAADMDVLEALRSGIVGEAEPLKRFGIVMQEATLQAFALEQGITKSVKSMSIAEKTTLRYNFILDQTQLAQGDAAKTSEGWANASKGLVSALKDLGTRIGLTILPFAERVVISIRNATRAFLEWQKGTNFLKAVLIVLGAIGAKVALGLLASWLPVLAPFAGIAIAVILAALALDDFITFMEGGDSVIGRFIDSIFGPGSATEAVSYLKEAWEGMQLFWEQEVVPTMEALGAKYFDVNSAMIVAYGLFFDVVKEGNEDLIKLYGIFFDSIGLGWDIIIESMGKKFNEWFNEIEKALTVAARFLGIDIKPITRQKVSDRERGIPENVLFGDLTGAGPQTQTRPGPAPAAGPITTSVENTITVQVQGSATAADAARIANEAGEAQRKANRRTRAALIQLTEE